MEWERKFYDIVRETESNLANARRKLHGNRKTSLVHVECSRLSEQPAFSYQPLASTSSVDDNDHINGIRRHLGWSLPSTPQSPAVAGTSLHAPLSNELRELQSKVDSQSRMIESLKQLVKALNQEKEEYQQQIRDLQNEVGSINTRLSGTGSVDPQLKTQVDLVQQEVRTDLQRLQNITSASKPTAQYCSLERSFKDMQRSVHSELEELRRDLNSIVHRVGKLELDVSTHNTSHRDLQSRQSQTLPSVGNASNTGRFGQPSYVPTKQAPPLTPGDVFQVKELRNTVSQLHDKLDSLEGRIAASQSSSLVQSPVHLSKFQETPSKALKSDVKVMFRDFEDDEDNTDLDDFGISDEFDLDIPIDDKDLSDDLDEIITISKKNATSHEIDGIFRDDVLNDELDDIGVRMTAGIGTQLPNNNSNLKGMQRRDKEATPTFQQPSTAGQMKGATHRTGVLSDLDLDQLDLDSITDPFDLDSLDGASIDLKLDEL